MERHQREEAVDVAQYWPEPDRQARWRQLMAWLDPRPGERVLDVGFGGGQALHHLARRVAPTGYAVGVDRSARWGAGLATHFAPIGPMLPVGLIGDAAQLPFAENTFDAVICVNALEAVPDRLAAIAELYRVLRPGGRLLLAHDDYESQVYACAERDLSRRAVLAYARSTFASYATSDGQMGRHLWGIFRRAGFRDADMRVLPLVNTEYREPLLGWVHAQFDAELVAPVSDLTQADLDRWRASLREASDQGTYLYCINLFVCLGRK